MLTEQTKTRGRLLLVLIDSDGNVKQESTHNLIVDAGLGYLAARNLSNAVLAMSHIAVGTGAAAAAAGDTTLGTELVRVALGSSALITTTVTNDTVEHVTTLGAGVGTGSLTEAGLFNAATAGTMLARAVFGVLTKAAGDSLTITWQIQQS